MVKIKFIQSFIARWKQAMGKFPKATDHKVKYAFTVGGIDYYEMDDLFNLPYKRGMAAMSVYEELRMKCSYEFLKAHVDACDNVLSAPKFNLASALQLKKLNDQIKERLTWITDLDLAYKLAAVVYFDKTESPVQYEAKYAQQKVEHWKKHEGAADFFLREPLTRLLPFLKDADLNFQIYSQVVKQFNDRHWGNIFSNLSAEQKKTYSDKPSTSSVGATPRS